MGSGFIRALATALTLFCTPAAVARCNPETAGFLDFFVCSDEYDRRENRLRDELEQERSHERDLKAEIRDNRQRLANARQRLADLRTQYRKIQGLQAELHGQLENMQSAERQAEGDLGTLERNMGLIATKLSAYASLVDKAANAADLSYDEFAAMRNAAGLAADAYEYNKLRQRVAAARGASAKLRVAATQLSKKALVGIAGRFIPIIGTLSLAETVVEGLVDFFGLDHKSAHPGHAASGVR
ncbi:MAG: hypothetical protein JZU52_07065 [Lamprocystis purpurea]|jgi:Skp family chaperone for outer membrane proteins|uniref:hypothetical protein n=1 Tax=Lamprocystis purpurea TaxID=61598 RepID=UPI0005914F5E|nr:hypothetical protein [Lamprocystis purpurea]MBV5273396.1 hypothetical protein [Lamprocystis purpurea]